jgi:microcystin-dependent protein
MSNPYVGQIIMFAGDFAPPGWALCNGQLLPIGGNEVLFNLIGTTYGGDGSETFALPDMRSRVPIGQGRSPPLSSYALGDKVGSETVALRPSTLAPHTHRVVALNGPGSANAPSGNALLSALGGQAGSGPDQIPAYAPPNHQTALNAASVGPTGGGQAHDNRQPYQAVNFCIALTGIYPSG